MGGYTAAAERDAASDAHPAADVRDSTAGLQAMDVDAAPGASPAGPSGGAAPAGSPEDADVAPADAHGLPPELLHPPRGTCDPAVKVGMARCIVPPEPQSAIVVEASSCVGRRLMLSMLRMCMRLCN